LTTSPLAESAVRATVFLAETTSDLREQREAIKRDLQQQGYVVLPTQPLPLVVAELKDVLREDLAQCQLSIHPVGKNYSLVPEGATTSMVEIQNEMTLARAEQRGFSRLVWIPAGIKVEDNRQQRVLDALRFDLRLQPNTDLLETTLEDLRTLYHDRLKRAASPELNEAPPPSPNAGAVWRQVYVIFDQRDADLTAGWTDFLFKQGFEVTRPVFEGDEAEIREFHQENLVNCDGVLIIYGKANELWLRRKLREVQKTAGYGRTKPMPTVGIWVVPPKTAEKETFRTHEAVVMHQMDTISPDSLTPFISRLTAS
jgi:hypothetical protein